MIQKKATPPEQAGTLGKVALTTAHQDSKSRALRQQLSQLIFRSRLCGFIPAFLAEWLTRWGGLRHD